MTNDTTICRYCRGNLNPLTTFSRKSKKGWLMMFCSLQCNVDQLAGNVRDKAGEKLYQEGLQQLKEWKAKEL